MADISLTASMRSNLLSLQQTQSLMDMTQERLSTGKKVNSAIDNPSSYYAAQSLTNRASDLSALLDSMGQAIQTIQAADEGIETITEFAEQAKAIANQARDEAVVAKTASEIKTPTNLTEGKTFKVTVTDTNGEVKEKTLTVGTDGATGAEASANAIKTLLTGDTDVNAAIQGVTIAADKSSISVEAKAGYKIVIEDVDAGVYNYQIGVFYIDFISECEKLGDYILNVVQATKAEKV